MAVLMAPRMIGAGAGRLNGDGKNSDRPAGVDRNDQDGPVFRQLSLRLSKSFSFLADQRLDVITEAFNVTDATNYDVNSIDTLPGREIQLGLRWAF